MRGSLSWHVLHRSHLRREPSRTAHPLRMAHPGNRKVFEKLGYYTAGMLALPVAVFFLLHLLLFPGESPARSSVFPVARRALTISRSSCCARMCVGIVIHSTWHIVGCQSNREVRSRERASLGGSTGTGGARHATQREVVRAHKLVAGISHVYAHAHAHTRAREAGGSLSAQHTCRHEPGVHNRSGAHT